MQAFPFSQVFQNQSMCAIQSWWFFLINLLLKTCDFCWFYNLTMWCKIHNADTHCKEKSQRKTSHLSLFSLYFSVAIKLSACVRALTFHLWRWSGVGTVTSFPWILAFSRDAYMWMDASRRHFVTCAYFRDVTARNRTRRPKKNTTLSCKIKVKLIEVELLQANLIYTFNFTKLVISYTRLIDSFLHLLHSLIPLVVSYLSSWVEYRQVF